MGILDTLLGQGSSDAAMQNPLFGSLIRPDLTGTSPVNAVGMALLDNMLPGVGSALAKRAALTGQANGLSLMDRLMGGGATGGAPGVPGPMGALPGMGQPQPAAQGAPTAGDMFNATPEGQQTNTLVPNTGIDRSRIKAELDANPSLAQRLAAMIKGEVGYGDPKQAQIQLESAANRALTRKIPLSQALLSVADDPKRGYYASNTYGRTPSASDMATFGKILPDVLGGSDVGTQALGFLPTGNASQMDFAGRRAASGMYDASKWYSGKPGVGEMFVTEKGDAARAANLQPGAPRLPPEALSSTPSAPVQVASLDPQAGMGGSAPNASPAGPQMAQMAPPANRFIGSSLPDVPLANVRPGAPQAPAPAPQMQPAPQPQPTGGAPALGPIERRQVMAAFPYLPPELQKVAVSRLWPEGKPVDLGNETAIVGPRGEILGRLPKSMTPGEQANYGLSVAKFGHQQQLDAPKIAEALAQTQPAQGVSGGNSPVSVPSPPPGVNVSKFRDDSATKAADEVAKIREQGLGAIDFLKESGRAKQKFSSYSDNIFGPWMGSEAFNSYVRSPVASMPGGSDERRDTQDFAEKQGIINNLATAKFREKFGARPTQMEYAKSLEMVGGANSPNAKTSIQQIENFEKSSFDALQKSVQAGALDPKQIDPAIVQRGIDAGALDPRLFPGFRPQAGQGGAQAPAPVGGTTKSGIQWKVQ